MKLYFVAAVNLNGDNADLFVKAATVEEAVGYWRMYFDHFDVQQPTIVWEAPTDWHPNGAVPWAHITVAWKPV